MKTINKNLFSTLVLSVTAAAALIACGGGGGDTLATPAAVNTVVTADPITSASSAVATSIGATQIAGASSDEEVYDLVADIGDT